MKRISLVLLALTLWGAPALRAQDTATQEQLDKLTGQIQGLIDAQEVINKNIAQLARDLENLRSQVGGINTNAASPADLERLKTAIEKVDQQRKADYDQIVAKLEDLGKAVSSAAAAPSRRAVKPPPSEDSAPSAISERGIEYTIRPNDRLELIAEAYRQKGIKVTVDDILRNNPGLEPTKMYVGKRIWIPVPKQ